MDTWVGMRIGCCQGCLWIVLFMAILFLCGPHVW